MDHSFDFVLLGLLLTTVGLLVIARVTRVPYPILLVIGGAIVGAIPGIPAVELEPELVLIVVLPPLLYSAAYFTSLRDLRASARPISLLAIGLVVATTFTVAAAAHLAIGLPWEVACVLGAIVSPTDPVAATAIAQRLKVPARIVTIVEGESLVNDATALIAYRFAVAAVVTGVFSPLEAVGEFLLSSAGGIAIGVAVAYPVAAVRSRLNDPPTEIAIALVTAWLAALPAELLGVSSVLAAVTVGIAMGVRTPRLTTPTQRIQARAVWEIFTFILNALLFIVLGLQLRPILDAIDDPAGTLVTGAVAVCAAVILTRIVWVYVLTWLPRRLSSRLRARDPMPPWSWTTVVAWSGMRGAVSLAAALALPLTVEGGAPFPDRELVQFLVFSVILVTLVLQGLTLPALIRVLRVEDDGSTDAEEDLGRRAVAAAALRRIDDLRAEDWVHDDTADRLNALYAYRHRRYGDEAADEDGVLYDERSSAYKRLRIELLDAERRALLELARSGEIGGEALTRIMRDLDFEHARIQ